MSVQATTDTSSLSSRGGTALVQKLDDLLAVDLGGLERLYADAQVPRLEEISGDLRGRMLATTVLKEPFASLARMWARSTFFPWRGKSFSPLEHERGEGINRVVSDRLRLFRFETFIAKSRAGDFNAVQLDYDLPENPFFIRPIKDEIRTIAPKLYLGQAYLSLPKSTPLILYFGLAG
jgi:hypothetical protein